MAIDKCARKVGVSLNTLAFWVEQGELYGHITRLVSGRRRVSVAVGQEGKIEALNRELTLIDICGDLGVCKAAARSLLRDGLITSLPRSRGGTWRVTVDELRIFRKRLNENACGRALGRDEKSLNHIMRFYSTKGMTLSMILRPMLEKQLSYVVKESEGPRIGDMLFLDPKEVNGWILVNNLLTISDMASLLGVKQEVGYQLVNSGLIKTVHHGRLGRLVVEEDIDSFREHYRFLRDIARMQGISSKKLVEWARKANIPFKSGPSVDGHRQYIIDRSSAARLIAYIEVHR